MKVLNENHKDFSNEFLAMMAAAGYAIYGAQLVIEGCARMCDLNGLKESFFQNKRRAIGEAAKAFDVMRKNLQIGFDDWFGTVYKDRLDYFNFVHQSANDIMRLILLYMSRTDDHPELREVIFNFIKMMQVEDTADWDDILHYFEKRF